MSNPWQVAARSDLIYPQTQGHRGPGTDRINAYLDRVTVAAAFDKEVHIALSQVLQLLVPPQRLMRPATMLRVRKVMRSLVRLDRGVGRFHR